MNRTERNTVEFFKFWSKTENFLDHRRFCTTLSRKKFFFLLKGKEFDLEFFKMRAQVKYRAGDHKTI